MFFLSNNLFIVFPALNNVIRIYFELVNITKKKYKTLAFSSNIKCRWHKKILFPDDIRHTLALKSTMHFPATPNLFAKKNICFRWH